MRMFQISEDDLASLEAELPEILSHTMMACNDPLLRKRWDAVKKIMSDVRWNYGPPIEVSEIKADEPPDWNP